MLSSNERTKSSERRFPKLSEEQKDRLLEYLKKSHP
jgi:hypothetical protein